MPTRLKTIGGKDPVKPARVRDVKVEASEPQPSFGMGGGSTPPMNEPVRMTSPTTRPPPVGGGDPFSLEDKLDLLRNTGKVLGIVPEEPAGDTRTTGQILKDAVGRPIAKLKRLLQPSRPTPISKLPPYLGSPSLSGNAPTPAPAPAPAPPPVATPPPPPVTTPTPVALPPL